MGFQTSGALLDFIVLGILQNGDEYGYILTQQVREMLDVSETAMYPALRRRQKGHLLTTYDRSCQGRNRRYYQLTAEGRKALNAYVTEWEQFKRSMDQILGGNRHDDSAVL